MNICKRCVCCSCYFLCGSIISIFSFCALAVLLKMDVMLWIFVRGVFYFILLFVWAHNQHLRVLCAGCVVGNGCDVMNVCKGCVCCSCCCCVCCSLLIVPLLRPSLWSLSLVLRVDTILCIFWKGLFMLVMLCVEFVVNRAPVTAERVVRIFSFCVVLQVDTILWNIFLDRCVCCSCVPIISIFSSCALAVLCWKWMLSYEYCSCNCCMCCLLLIGALLLLSPWTVCVCVCVCVGGGFFERGCHLVKYH